MKTTAQRIAEACGTDRRDFRTGVEGYSTALMEKADTCGWHGQIQECDRALHSIEVQRVRYEFTDGSAILVCYALDCWGVEGSEPFIFANDEYAWELLETV